MEVVFIFYILGLLHFFEVVFIMFGYGLVGPSMVWLALIWAWNGLDLAYPYFSGGWVVGGIGAGAGPSIWL